MKEIAVKMTPLMTPRRDYIGSSECKEAARLEFIELYQNLPCEHQELIPTNEGLLRGYWRPSILPSRVEGNTIYYQC